VSCIAGGGQASSDDEEGLDGKQASLILDVMGRWSGVPRATPLGVWTWESGEG
jgi:hypothetical protein